MTVVDVVVIWYNSKIRSTDKLFYQFGFQKVKCLNKISSYRFCKKSVLVNCVTFAAPNNYCYENRCFFQHLIMIHCKKVVP